MYKTIKDNCSAEIIEKKSKFIGQIYYIENTEQAEKILNDARKKYFDARHNCYAYTILDQKSNRIISKISDDGEPTGTAGGPILDVLIRKKTSKCFNNCNKIFWWYITRYWWISKSI